MGDVVDPSLEESELLNHEIYQHLLSSIGIITAALVFRLVSFVLSVSP